MEDTFSRVNLISSKSSGTIQFLDLLCVDEKQLASGFKPAGLNLFSKEDAALCAVSLLCRILSQVFLYSWVKVCRIIS